MSRAITLLGLLAIGALTTARADVVTQWHAITVNCVQGPQTPANRPGPAGVLDIALTQLAVHDAVQAVQGRFEPYEYSNTAHGSADRPVCR
jgi:hypothetical protein